MSKEETDYFKLLGQIRQSQLQVMKNYPYMMQFINKSREENVSEALLETEDKRGVLPERYAEIMSRADLSRFKPEADVVKITKVIEYTVDGLMAEHFLNGSFQPEIYHGEMEQYLDMMRKLSYR